VHRRLWLVAGKDGLLREVARVLPPGGRVAITPWERRDGAPAGLPSSFFIADTGALAEAAGLRVLVREERGDWLEQQRRFYRRVIAEDRRGRAGASLARRGRTRAAPSLGVISPAAARRAQLIGKVRRLVTRSSWYGEQTGDSSDGRLPLQLASACHSASAPLHGRRQEDHRQRRRRHPPGLHPVDRRTSTRPRARFRNPAQSPASCGLRRDLSRRACSDASPGWILASGGRVHPERAQRACGGRARTRR